MVSNYGSADLRARISRQSAELIIEKCVHPMYCDGLNDYLQSAHPNEPSTAKNEEWWRQQRSKSIYSAYSYVVPNIETSHLPLFGLSRFIFRWRSLMIQIRSKELFRFVWFCSWRSSDKTPCQSWVIHWKLFLNVPQPMAAKMTYFFPICIEIDLCRITNHLKLSLSIPIDLLIIVCSSR